MGSQATEEKLVLELSRTIRAPRERGFAAFASAEELKRWFGPGECFVADGEMDFRVGGEYRLAMITSDFGGVDLVGTFREIVPCERLVYTWEGCNNENMRWGQMLVTVTFSEVDGGTEVNLHHAGMPAAEVCEGHRVGWDGSFDKLNRCYGGGEESSTNKSN